MVDANVVIAAFLRDSTVRRLLALSVLQLFVPDFLWVEFRNRLPELRRRAGLAVPTANEVVKWIERHLVVLPAEALLVQWELARRAMAAIDPNDVAYVAAASLFLATEYGPTTRISSNKRLSESGPQKHWCPICVPTACGSSDEARCGSRGSQPRRRLSEPKCSRTISPVPSGRSVSFIDDEVLL